VAQIKSFIPLLSCTLLFSGIALLNKSDIVLVVRDAIRKLVCLNNLVIVRICGPKSVNAIHR
jgi:hypothetical protein